MKRKIAIVNGLIYTGVAVFDDKALLVYGDRIVDIIDDDVIPEEYERFDVDGNFVCAGLIDLQIYGTGTDLFSAELTSESIKNIESKLLKQGCTSFLLTLATNTLDVFKQAVEVFKSTQAQSALGLHLEGPFLNQKKRGAHPGELILEPTIERLRSILEDDAGAVRMMTVAPERISQPCIDYLLKKGILVSAGHSDASFDQAYASFDRGIQTVTHLWNAMSALHHRNPGLPAACFNHPSVKASIIVDGIHVDYNTVKISKALLQDRLFLITDAVAACDKDIYKHVLAKDHYELEDGTLSGSALSMLDAIKNCVRHVGIDLHEAIRMATLYPSNLIGRNDLGRLEPQAKANILVFREDFTVESVFFMGEEIAV